MLSQEIRQAFLGFFEARGHRRVPSAPLIPRHDPSLLLVGAGMVPFKPYFLGQQAPPHPRLTSCQKCFRATDIAEVGDLSHDTFFEMLGNFSFGDYHRAEAIEFAFKLLTEDFGLEAERLYPSVHPTDEQSFELWQRVAGIPSERIPRLEENFWQAGPTGPCGVDSEIYFDLGPQFGAGRDERPGRGERYLEIWNLVFMDSERLEDGRTVPLSDPGVDTGMGLERIAMVLQGVGSIFETDLFAPIRADFDGRCPQPGALAPDQRQRHLRILADHARGACMLLADGVLPGNEGLGYLVRRLIRRALVSGAQLGLEGGLAAGVGAVVAVLGATYQELAAAQAQVRALLEQEESRFAQTLERGLEQFEEVAAGAEGGVIGAEALFHLHDTLGFPMELSEDLAQARGLGVDRPGAEALLEAQRARGRSHQHGDRAGEESRELPTEAAQLAPGRGEFVGYSDLEARAAVGAAVVAGAPVASLAPGAQGWVFLDRTPFYAEAGGQQGDRGWLRWAEGGALVLDTQADRQGGRWHLCKVERGQLQVGGEVLAEVDQARRRGCAAHHSATHLLNATLHHQLGDGVVQRGSLVGPDHATFDFGWPEPLGGERLRALESELNQAVRRDLARDVDLMSLEQAREQGALALPEETYSQEVRVVSFGDYSKELCGGTHVQRSGEIGAVVLLSERSVGSGLRRIELRAGPAAVGWWQEQQALVSEVSRGLQVAPPELGERARALSARVRELERRLAQSQGPGQGRRSSETVDGVRVELEEHSGELEGNQMLQVADRLLQEVGSGCAVVLAGQQLAIKISSDLVARGLHAGTVAGQVCGRSGGRGGGNPQLGRGNAPQGREAVLAALRVVLGSDREVV